MSGRPQPPALTDPGMAFRCPIEETCVANTPHRRHPKNYPETRRRPRGIRVARDHSERLDRLKLAASRLREHGYTDSAQEVERLTVPGGWEALKRAVQSGSRASLSPTADKRVRDALYAMRDDFEVSLHAVADEGLLAVKEGRWLPPEPVPMPPGTLQKTSLPLNVDGDLLEEVRKMLPALTRKAGYKVTVGGILVSWLMEEFGVEQPELGEPKRDRTLQVIVPSPLRDHFVQELKRQGLELDEVMAEGAARVLDGSWEPDRVSFTAASRSTHMAKVTTHLPDRETLEALRAKSEELAARSGQRIKLRTVAVAILVDRLGQPAE